MMYINAGENKIIPKDATFFLVTVYRLELCYVFISSAKIL